MPQEASFISGTSENKGIGDALEWPRTTPFGSSLTMIIAIGLFAFGIYSLLEAIFRRIENEAAQIQGITLCSMP